MNMLPAAVGKIQINMFGGALIGPFEVIHWKHQGMVEEGDFLKAMW